MSKEEILKDVQSLIKNIDKCTTDIVQGRVTGDAIRVNEALCDMESLVVKAHQEFTFLYDYIKNLWKDAQGDELPPIDKEVIAILDNGKVIYAYRPNPEGWDAVSIITEKREHYVPECYGKGGWNQPNVRFWLDLDLPVKEGSSDE